MPQNNQEAKIWTPSLHFAEISHKGSILLYVLFLSSFLVLFFISFQWEIEKTLEGARDSEASIQDASSIQDALVQLKNAPVATRAIDTNEHLSLVSLNETGNTFSGSLGGSGSQEYWITSAGAASIGLTVTSWWPVFYRLAAFASGSEASATVVSSGMVTTSTTINLSPTLDQHILTVDPLGWSVQYTLNASSTSTIPATSTYRLERDINGYKKDEWMYNIINFVPKSRTNFDYQKMGMYLK